jgi:hypothetical protein
MLLPGECEQEFKLIDQELHQIRKPAPRPKIAVLAQRSAFTSSRMIDIFKYAGSYDR